MGRTAPLRPTELDTPCVQYDGSINDRGYGYLYVDGRQILAHRVAVAQTDGWDAIEGRVVMHLCDNPPCVRRDHLALVDKATNVRDMWRKGRGVTGERHSKAKLTAEQVATIRARSAAGERVGDIAADYPVTRSNVGHIINHVTWKELV
jgi:hypothetical protein